MAAASDFYEQEAGSRLMSSVFFAYIIRLGGILLLIANIQDSDVFTGKWFSDNGFQRKVN